jgi:hypothetical protein
LTAPFNSTATRNQLRQGRVFEHRDQITIAFWLKVPGVHDHLGGVLAKSDAAYRAKTGRRHGNGTTWASPGATT